MVQAVPVDLRRAVAAARAFPQGFVQKSQVTRRGRDVRQRPEEMLL